VAPHKKIRAVEFVDAIPKTPSGKILRRVLKDRVRARAAG
jgi:acyl-coenzyme A synthetase/AMP-(fatty) acid ligase